VVLERELADAQVRRGAKLGADLPHPGFDRVVAHRERHGHAVVTVFDEVQPVDPVNVDGRHVLAALTRGGNAEPPTAQVALRGSEPAIELVQAPADRADDRIEPDGLDPQFRLRPWPSAPTTSSKRSISSASPGSRRTNRLTRARTCCRSPRSKSLRAQSVSYDMHWLCPRSRA